VSALPEFIVPRTFKEQKTTRVLPTR